MNLVRPPLWIWFVLIARYKVGKCFIRFMSDERTKMCKILFLHLSLHSKFQLLSILLFMIMARIIAWSLNPLRLNAYLPGPNRSTIVNSHPTRCFVICMFVVLQLYTVDKYKQKNGDFAHKWLSEVLQIDGYKIALFLKNFV